MDLKVEMKLVKKDWYTLIINDNEVGTYERSQFRLMLSVIDDAITTGLVASLGDEKEPMSKEDFMKMIEEGRRAAEEDEDCVMCGS